MKGKPKMTRISEYHNHLTTTGFTLNAHFSYHRHPSGSTTLTVTHYYSHKDGYTCTPAQAVRELDAPASFEKWLADIDKTYWEPVTAEDVDEFCDIWSKKLTAAGIDPDTVVQVDGEETIC